ncbi:MAG: GNAT family N-acetyltransferase [Pseudomonadota bacterium]|nr:GNAT family N-acetyltransferase [Pseudomonadota bacterium]
MADQSQPPLTIRNAVTEDLDQLVALSRKTFTDKFGHLYSATDLETFLETEHGPNVYRTALAEPSTVVKVAEGDDGRLGAYLVCGPLTLPAKSAAPKSVELKRIYVDEALQGRGLGTHFIKETIAWARQQNAPELYLSVFSENYGAQRIYERFGFEKISEFIFPVGDHQDLEFLMRLTLE